MHLPPPEGMMRESRCAGIYFVADRTGTWEIRTSCPDISKPFFKENFINRD
jgi:hypothetical protein